MAFCSPSIGAGTLAVVIGRHGGCALVAIAVLHEAHVFVRSATWGSAAVLAAREAIPAQRRRTVPLPIHRSSRRTLQSLLDCLDAETPLGRIGFEDADPTG